MCTNATADVNLPERLRDLGVTAEEWSAVSERVLLVIPCVSYTLQNTQLFTKLCLTYPKGRGGHEIEAA